MKGSWRNSWESVFGSLSILRVCVCHFWQENVIKKAVRKLCVKLTTERQIVAGVRGPSQKRPTPLHRAPGPDPGQRQTRLLFPADEEPAAELDSSNLE
jgi:hypothetical protein